MIFGMTTFTLIHMVLSLIGIVAGLVVAGGLVAGKRLDRWAIIFLVTAIATSVTGFGFPFVKFLSSYAVGIVRLGVLAVVILAQYVKHFAAGWRRAYAVSVALARASTPLFPALIVAAPHQPEPSFALTQGLVLALFVWLAVAAGQRIPRRPGRRGLMVDVEIDGEETCAPYLEHGMTSKLILLSGVAVMFAAACGDSTSPSPSARGRLAFASIRDGNWNIYSANPDGTDIQRLTADPATDVRPAFSTDRRRVAFYSERSPAGIYIMNANGTEARFLYAADAQSMSWAPDDRRIVFQGLLAAGGYGIFVLDVAQRAAVPIRGDAGSPAWSPNGVVIAFTDLNFGGVWVMRPDGSEAREILPDALDPAWSPDGRRIAFTAGSIYAMNPDGSSVTRLTDTPGVSDRGPAWSPDGGRVAFTRENFPTADVWTVGADGTDLRQITNGPATNGGVTW